MANNPQKLVLYVEYTNPRLNTTKHCCKYKWVQYSSEKTKYKNNQNDPISIYVLFIVYLIYLHYCGTTIQVSSKNRSTLNKLIVKQ